MRQGREKQLERWTFDLPSSSTGRMWKEEERQRKSMCERQPMDRATPGVGVGAGGAWAGGASCHLLRGEVGAWSGCREALSVPPNRSEGPVSRIGSLWPG